MREIPLGIGEVAPIKRVDINNAVKDDQGNSVFNFWNGQTLILPVKSNPSTGYTWSVESFDGDCVKNETEGSGYAAKSPGRQRYGAGGT